jgi:hypothetical protein
VTTFLTDYCSPHAHSTELKPSVRKRIETAAQKVLDARKAEQDRCTAQQQKCSLAMLYVANGMPVDLVKAHNDLDKAVDAAYDYKPNRSTNLSLYSRATDDAAGGVFV